MVRKAPEALSVTWKLDGTGAPQFSCRLDVYRNQAGQGEPAISISRIVPHLRSELVDVSSLSLSDTKYYLHLRCTDILDRASDVKVVELPRGP